MDWLFSPKIHYLMTLVHVTCALFWLGWMVFFSLIMVPVLRKEVPEKFNRIRRIIQYRTRQPVKLMIVLLVLSGLYNMAYRGLLDLRTLLYTEFGLWFVLKLFLATLLIGLYFLAPDFSRMEPDSGAADSDLRQSIVVYVHGIILTLGFAVAYLGIGVGG